jgi:hypothetical protein
LFETGFLTKEGRKERKDRRLVKTEILKVEAVIRRKSF